MIFKYGFVHCDAHPGNILVRRKPQPQKKNEHVHYPQTPALLSPDDYQIVLLDHGLYRHLDQEFIHDFSKFWVSLIKLDKKNLLKDAQKLNI